VLNFENYKFSIRLVWTTAGYDMINLDSKVFNMLLECLYHYCCL